MEKIEKIKEYIQQEMTGEATGHDWFHIERVLHNALHINETEKGNEDIIVLASLLHDIGDHKVTGSHDTLVSVPKEVMERFDIDTQTQDAVCEIISQISFSGSGMVPSTLEGRIVQDADRLDALGAIGVARTFAYGGKKNRVLWDPTKSPIVEFDSKEAYYANEGSSLNHFDEKLFKLKEKFNTDTGKKVAQERDAFLHEFYDRFKDEWYGRK